MRGIYAIVDLETLSRAHVDPIAFAREIALEHPVALQLRAKNASARETLKLLEALRPICSSARVPLVANDRVDLAVAAHCDLVHLGQDDLSIAHARQIAPGLGVGVSTHDPEQLARALTSRPAYVAYGPVFATPSKRNHEPVVGLEGLAAARALIAASTAPTTPLVAIGGISAVNLHQVLAHADAVAVIGALVAENPRARLRELQATFGAFA